METVRSAAISGQYPMWIDDLNIIGYDYERLNVHLSQVLNYGQETILQLRGEPSHPTRRKVRDMD